MVTITDKEIAKKLYAKVVGERPKAGKKTQNLIRYLGTTFFRSIR